MAQEDNPSISTSTGLSTSASTSASVPASTPAPAPVPTSMPTSTDTPTPMPTPAVAATPVPVVPVTDARDAAPPPAAPLTSTASTNSVPPPTSSTSPPPPPPSATPTLTSTPTPTPTAEPLSIATANANANASTPLPVAATSTAPATTNATAPAPAAAPALPPQQNGEDARVPSPGMANQPPPGPPRNYPSPNNFSSPALPTGQYATYHAQPSQPPADHYRASPGAPVPSLPSMKSLPDPHFQQGAPQHQHQHQHAHQHQHQHPHQHQQMPMQMSMPPNPAAMSYYMNPAVQNPYMQDLSAMRYPIAPGPHDPRLMRGPGGPKKEIKRRTKTGCLTCRKRRIKCDEAHPTCNNCKKSKRECLGYDPIFKQQPGPSAIQPAPNAPRVPTPTVPSLPSSSVPPAVPTVPSTPAAPVPLPVTSTNPYGNQPAVLPSSYNAVPAASHAPLDPALTATTPSVKTETGYDFAAPMDPALHNLPTPATIPSTQNQPFAADHRAGFDNHLRATNMRVDDLIGLLGPAAPTQEIALTPELLAEIVNIYHEVYASGLQAFFETAWFSTKDAQGKYPMEHSQAILSQFASFVKVLQAVPANDHTQMAHSGVLESRLIWALASLPRNSASVTSSAALTEAAGRVQVVDTLLTGDFLSANPLVAPTSEPNPHRRQELEFWYNLAEYLRYHDPVKRDEILGRLRLQLGGRENRDLIYSIAISREISPRVEPGFERTIPQHLDESDPKNRLYVANKFIREEAQVTGGTTNIVRRFSEIAIRSFISPGVNIARPAPAAPAQP